jgi:hypothetical protein
VKTLALVCLVACGDNTPAIGPPLAQADTLLVAAHTDDDEIFMQPELVRALQSGGSLTTLFVTTGDPIYGDAHALSLFDSALVAYGAIAGSQDWDCGYLTIADAPIHHCRLRDRPVSLIGLDLPDGGIAGTGPVSLLDLVDGSDADVPIIGAMGGRATTASIIAELAAIITVTVPLEIHALELAGTHGYDHSSHMFSSAFTWWAAATLGYPGPITWHRGYNVETEAVTLDGVDHADPVKMVGYYEACADKCGPCGDSCATVSSAHDTWLSRQYAVTRVPTATGTLGDGTSCFGDCSTFTLEAGGHLTANGQCLGSTADGGTAFVPCAADPAQAWVLDSEGSLWNGAMPAAAGDMTFDHVRCLTMTGTPVCGAHLQAHWQFI